jgi:hypothetical protein
VEVEFICLANSWKHQGRCVAGLRIGDGRWIRPVSSTPDGTLFSPTYRYRDGAEATPLDVVRVDIARANPEYHQPENWLLSPKRWTKVRHYEPHAAWPLLSPHLESATVLFGTYGDYVDYSVVLRNPLPSSLTLVEPDEVIWIVQTREGRRRLYAAFMLGGEPYRLSISDPLWFQRLATLEEGGHERNVAGLSPTDRMLFTVSLGEPFGPSQRCFKLIAGVIVIPALV